MTQKILVVSGTRPEAIKLCPVILRLRAEPEAFAVRVCATAQHREMLDTVLDLFDVRPDIDLDLMQPGQSLNQLMGRMAQAIDRVLEAERPDWVIVQGDTITAMTCALAAFHRGVRVAHVEAGLRTGDLQAPFPEEANRRVISVVAEVHFAPTQWAADHLRREGVAETRIVVTGNTVIDALLTIAAQAWTAPVALAPLFDHAGPLLLVTMHRRESFGAPMRAVCQALTDILAARPDARVLLPVHPNPQVAGVVREALAGVAGVTLCDPLAYRDFVHAMKRADVVLTDSGGVQEEAPSFGKQVLVLRDTTERPEGVAAGCAVLVGTDPDRIVDSVLWQLSVAAREAMRGQNPYGDGQASHRIVQALKTLA